MRAAELADAFTLAGIANVPISVEPLRHNAFCVVRLSSGQWEAYYSERGRKFDRKVFGSEHEACLYVFDRHGGVDATVARMRAGRAPLGDEKLAAVGSASERA